MNCAGIPRFDRVRYGGFRSRQGLYPRLAFLQRSLSTSRPARYRPLTPRGRFRRTRMHGSCGYSTRRDDALRDVGRHTRDIEPGFSGKRLLSIWAVYSHDARLEARARIAVMFDNGNCAKDTPPATICSRSSRWHRRSQATGSQSAAQTAPRSPGSDGMICMNLMNSSHAKMGRPPCWCCRRREPSLSLATAPARTCDTPRSRHRGRSARFSRLRYTFLLSMAAPRSQGLHGDHPSASGGTLAARSPLLAAPTRITLPPPQKLRSISTLPGLLRIHPCISPASPRLSARTISAVTSDALLVARAMTGGMDLLQPSARSSANARHSTRRTADHGFAPSTLAQS